MKTHKITDENGNLFAFEVSNTWLSRRKAVKVVEKLSAVEITKRPKWFSFQNPDVFCEFTYKGAMYQVEEPWGDNSRYWIGPKSNSNKNEIAEILECFNGTLNKSFLRDRLKRYVLYTAPQFQRFACLLLVDEQTRY